METYNDRPRSTVLGRAGFFYTKPRTAYAVCRALNFAISLAISVPVWIFGFSLYRTYGTEPSGFLLYAVWLGLFGFVSHSLWKSTHAFISGMDSSDVRSLACLRQSHGVFWQGYGKNWISYFPHLAERIDPATGNIGKAVVSSSKSWEVLEGELESLIATSE